MRQLRVTAGHRAQGKRGHRGDWMQRGLGQGGRRRGRGVKRDKYQRGNVRVERGPAYDHYEVTETFTQAAVVG